MSSEVSQVLVISESPSRLSFLRIILCQLLPGLACLPPLCCPPQHADVSTATLENDSLGRGTTSSSTPPPLLTVILPPSHLITRISLAPSFF